MLSQNNWAIVVSRWGYSGLRFIAPSLFFVFCFTLFVVVFVLFLKKTLFLILILKFKNFGSENRKKLILPLALLDLGIDSHLDPNFVLFYVQTSSLGSRRTLVLKKPETSKSLDCKQTFHQQIYLSPEDIHFQQNVTSQCHRVQQIRCVSGIMIIFQKHITKITSQWARS